MTDAQSRIAFAVGYYYGRGPGYNNPVAEDRVLKANFPQEWNAGFAQGKEDFQEIDLLEQSLESN